MVPISVTGVHNCLSNCFITGEEAWAPSALPPHLDFGKPSPAEMRSLSWVLTCICLLPWFPRSASFICTPILTQTPLMEIPMAGGGGALVAVCWRGGTHAFCHEWKWSNVKIRINHANDVSLFLCSSEVQEGFPPCLWVSLHVIPVTCMVRRPLRFPSRDLLS